MKALDRKLLRDLRQTWSQALTIALVVASGVAGFVTTLSAIDSLAQARDRHYAEARFADVFATVKRAPLSLGETLRDVPGVADLQLTVEQTVRIGIDGVDDPILGHLIGVDPRHPPRINRVALRAGRMPHAGDERGGSDGEAIEALVSAGFADARGLRPGARLRALVNGRERTLRIVGIALSPEYVFAGYGGMPDMRGFGVFWLDHDTLAAASDMAGAFNHVAVTLAPGASHAEAVAGIERVISPWGGREAHDRREQASHAMLDNEIREQRVLGTVLPTIFLAVAAFLLNVVISRTIATQREQIAALKALGYPDRRIAGHYFTQVVAIVLVGLLLGLGLGKWLGTAMVGLYAEFFQFPRFDHRMAPGLVLASAAIAFATAALGTANPLLATMRLAPAEAMRPPAPGRYRPTLAERLGLRRMPTVLRMILRNLERRPLRSALAVVGVAAAVAIVILGNFFRDAIETVVDSKFRVELRADVIVWLAEPAEAAAVHELARLPGAVSVEAGRDVAVRIVHGHRSERITLQGLPAQPVLQRIVDVDDRAWQPSPDGLVMTDRLADKLGLRVGDAVRVEVLEGRARTLHLPLRATVRDMMGLNAYMERRALNRALGEDDVAGRFPVAVARGREAGFLAAAMRLPRIVGAFSKATLWRNMQDISARNIRIMSTILTAFATVIAIGVVYNNARIALAERTWELASLRVLGFSRAEVSTLLLGEMALVIALALPLGMASGYGLVHLIVEMLRSDQFNFPVTLRPRTYAWACLAVLGAAVASAMVVRRRIDRLDMVAALKTRE
ncbi:MAG: ABC transporter permease [Xanthomonadaceae bacterium]|nr:ABC transporter permease [Xanthomonadaceae bacterium]